MVTSTISPLDGSLAVGPAAPKSVLGRAVTILTLLHQSEDEVTLGRVVQATGLPKATAHRMLAELSELGLVEKTPTGSLRLGIRMFELGSFEPRHRHLRDAARPVIDRLRDTSGLTVHLAVLDGYDVVYLDKAVGTREGPLLPSQVGGRLPAHCTGVGRALLSGLEPDRLVPLFAAGLQRRTRYTTTMPGRLLTELEQARRRGFAVDREETMLGVVCAAALVRGPSGDGVAALSLAGSSYAVDLRRACALVHSAAARVASRLAATTTATGWAAPTGDHMSGGIQARLAGRVG